MTQHRRQLKAIMFTDIVGYTKLMTKNETSAMRLLRLNRGIHKQSSSKYGGKYLKEMGDGTLLSFATIIDSVNCAGELIRLCNQKNYQLKIGIHFGDVISEENDLFGEGVNLASRLEQVASPNQILVSGSIHANIRNKPGIRTKYLAERQFKNIDEPVKVYQVEFDYAQNIISDTDSRDTSIISSRSYKIIGLILLAVLILISALLFIIGPSRFNDSYQARNIQKPIIYEDNSIAVLPFRNDSPDPKFEYLCNGIMHSIIGKLASSNIFNKVIDPNSTIQYKNTDLKSSEIAGELNINYLVTGSLRIYNEDLKVNVHISDARNDMEIWSNEFNSSADEIMSIENKIAFAVLNFLSLDLTNANELQFQQNPTKNQKAYDLYLRGLQYSTDYSNRREKKDLDMSSYFYKNALEIDPEFYKAKVKLGYAYLDRVRFEGESTELYDSALAIAEDLNTQTYDSEHKGILARLYSLKGIHKNQIRRLLIEAVTSNPNDSEALIYLIWYLTLEESRYDLGTYLSLIGIENDPLNPQYYNAAGWNMKQLHQYDTAVQYFREGIRIQPDNAITVTNLASLLLEIYQDFETAEQLLQNALSFNPNNRNVLYTLSYFYSRTGEFKKSEEYWLEIINLIPNDYTVTQGTPWFPEEYAFTLLKLGKIEEADKYYKLGIERSLSMLEDSVHHSGASEYHRLARIYAQLDNNKESFKWLNQSLDQNSWRSPASVKSDIAFEKLANEKEFLDYLEETEKRIAMQLENLKHITDIPLFSASEILSEDLDYNQLSPVSK